MAKLRAKRKLREWNDPALRPFVIEDPDFPTPTEIRDEIQGYRNILMGRKKPPAGLNMNTPLALMEYADIVYGRACELEQFILRNQDEGNITKTGSYQQIRTQELRSFKDMAKSAVELGSRRLTEARVLHEQERLGREAVN